MVSLQIKKKGTFGISLQILYLFMSNCKKEPTGFIRLLFLVAVLKICLS